MAFRLQEAWVYRYTYDHLEIDNRLTKQQDWRDRMRARWPADGMNRYHSPITEQVRTSVKLIAGFIQSIQSDYKLIITSNQLRLYTNDLNLLYDVSRLGFITEKRYSEVIIDRPKNTVKVANPKHQYRSYFRETKITQGDRKLLKDFVESQPGIRAGQGLKKWLDDNSNSYASGYTRDYFFIDHDHPGWPTMLALVRPGLIRKTVDIIAK